MKSLRRCRGFLVFLVAIALVSAAPERSAETHSAEAPAEFESCAFSTPGLITWSPAEIECPVCQTKNTFMVWVSYGNYVYQFPSKYQLVFWPVTDPQSWYSCKKCRYTAFIGEFSEVPKDKIADLRKLLEGISLPAQEERSNEQSRLRPPYLDIPTSQRLLAVEKIRRFLGETDDRHWDHFYRVLGYHFDGEKKQAEADEARRKSLAILERLLADKNNDGIRKDLLYRAGAMRHYLRDDVAALKDFEEAKKLTYKDKELKPEQSKNYDDYVSNLIKDYIEMLREGKGPRENPEGSH